MRFAPGLTDVRDLPEGVPAGQVTLGPGADTANSASMYTVIIS
jgi:hypothetical protein